MGPLVLAVALMGVGGLSATPVPADTVYDQRDVASDSGMSQSAAEDSKTQSQPAVSTSGAMYSSARPSGAAMLVDGVVVRPLGIVATAIGAVAWVITLPFSALGGNTEEAGSSLVGDPARFTFQRPLGDFPR